MTRQMLVAAVTEEGGLVGEPKKDAESSQRAIRPDQLGDLLTPPAVSRLRKSLKDVQT